MNCTATEQVSAKLVFAPVDLRLWNFMWESNVLNVRVSFSTGVCAWLCNVGIDCMHRSVLPGYSVYCAILECIGYVSQCTHLQDSVRERCIVIMNCQLIVLLKLWVGTRPKTCTSPNCVQKNRHLASPRMQSQLASTYMHALRVRLALPNKIRAFYRFAVRNLYSCRKRHPYSTFSV